LNKRDAVPYILLGNLEKGQKANNYYRLALKIDPTSPYYYFLIGENFIRSADFDSSSYYFRKSLQFDSVFVNANYGLAYSLSNLGRVSEALKYYNRAHELDPSRSDILLNRAVNYNELRRYGDALIDLQELLSNNHNPLAYYNLGIVYKNLDRNSDAKRALRQAINGDSKFSLPHLELGKIYLNNGGYDSALTELKWSIELEPQQADGYVYLGITYSYMGVIKESEMAFLHAINSSDSSDSNYHFNLATSYLHIGDTLKSLEISKKAVEKYPSDESSHLLLAKLLQSAKKYHDAIIESKVALSINPQNVTTLELIGQIYYQIDSIELARKLFIKAVELNPNSASSRNKLGGFYFATGMPHEALNEFLAAVRLEPFNASYSYNVGLAYNRQGDKAAAVSWFKKSAELGFPDAYLQLGAIYRTQSEINNAIGVYTTLNKLNPNNPLSHYWLGILYHKTRKYDLAITELLKATKLDSANSTYLHDLGRAYLANGAQNLAIKQFRESLMIDSLDILAKGESRDYLLKAYNLIQLREWEKSESYLKTLLIKNPKDYEIYYALACLFSLENKSEESLYWLKEAFEHGYNTLEYLSYDDDLDNIKNLKEFKALLSSYKSKSK